MKTILIIDDDDSIRENIAELLSIAGYNILEAGDGISGLKLAQEYKSIDLVLCDVMMPNLDGYGTLKIFNNNARLRQIPFVFLTAKSQREDFRQGMGLGAADYLLKPFDSVELLQTIDVRLQKKTIENRIQPLIINPTIINKRIDKLLLQYGVEVQYESKECIYKESTKCYFWYYILEGTVKYTYCGHSEKELITHLFKKGDFIGFETIIDSVMCLQSAISLSQVTLSRLPIDCISDILLSDSLLTKELFSVMRKRLVISNFHLSYLAYSSVRKRVANALVEFYNLYESNKFIAARQDLADLSGASVESVIRTLSDFKKEKLILLGGTISILKIDTLRNLPD